MFSPPVRTRALFSHLVAARCLLCQLCVSLRDTLQMAVNLARSPWKYFNLKIQAFAKRHFPMATFEACERLCVEQGSRAIKEHYRTAVPDLGKTDRRLC